MPRILISSGLFAGRRRKEEDKRNLRYLSLRTGAVLQPCGRKVSVPIKQT